MSPRISRDPKAIHLAATQLVVPDRSDCVEVASYRVDARAVCGIIGKRESFQP